MEKGREFLRAQINNTIAQHEELVENLKDHARQAEDRRYAQLCERYVPQMEQHHRMLKEYADSIGAKGDGGVKKALGSVVGAARSVVDSARDSDWLRLVGDIVMIRQAQDTFATFAVVGQQIGETRLAEIGRIGAQEHEVMSREFNELAHMMFVSHVQGSETTTGGRTEARTNR